MSYQAVDIFLAHSQSKGTTRTVGLVLAHYATVEDGAAWPSIDTLCIDTNASEASVRRALRELESLGEYKVLPRGNRRAYRLILACPIECDGDTRHGRNTASLATERRAADAERKRRQRGTVTTSEPTLEELSRSDLPGHDTLEGAVEELSRSDLPGHTPARTTDRTVVPVKLSGRSRSDLPGHRLDTSLREKELRTTTNTAPARTTPVDDGSSKAASAAGGGTTLEQLTSTARRLLPKHLGLQISRSAITNALRGPAALGLTPTQLETALQRSWEGAGTGAVIAHLRGLEPPEQPKQMERLFCPHHPHVETTHRQCQQCVEARQERARTGNNARRTDESLKEWQARIMSQSHT